MIIKFEEKIPIISKESFVAQNATIIGDVLIDKFSSIWYNVVLRGDIAPIYIGNNTSVQDGSVVHCIEGIPTVIGNNVTIGHNVTLHSCKIGNNSLIATGAIVLDGVEVGEGSIVGAGAIVTPKTKIPPFTMALGIPAKVVRDLSKEEIKELLMHALDYVRINEKIYVKSRVLHFVSRKNYLVC